MRTLLSSHYVRLLNAYLLLFYHPLLYTFPICHKNVNPEKIVMTPVVKQVGHTVLRMERKKVAQVVGPVHEAGGAHKGIVISKSIDEEEPPSSPTSSSESSKNIIYAISCTLATSC